MPADQHEKMQEVQNHYTTQKKFSISGKQTTAMQNMDIDSAHRIKRTGLSSGQRSPSKRVNAMARTGVGFEAVTPKVMVGINDGGGLVNA